MEAGCDVEVMVATNGGAAWVPGTLERFVTVNGGTEFERIGCDVLVRKQASIGALTCVEETLYRNCWLGSVRLPRSPDALDLLVASAVSQ